MLLSCRTTITTTNTTYDSSISLQHHRQIPHHKHHRRSKHRSRAPRVVWSSDSDTSTSQDTSAFVDYLVSLSACPALMPRRRSHRRRRRQTHSWEVGGPCRAFPARSIEPQVMGSNSTSSTETVKSEFGNNLNGNYSQDSLDEDDNSLKSKEQELITKRLKEMAVAFEVDRMQLIPTQTHNNNSSGDEEADLERELCFLQQQLVVATRWEEASTKGRGNWIDPSTVVKSWSTELAGNFCGNEKVKFSYENILSPSLLPIKETSSYHHPHQPSSICSESSQISSYSLPEPVENTIKFLDRVRHDSTHDKFSPRPSRKMLSAEHRALSISSATTATPRRLPTHRRASSLSRDFGSGGGGVGGGAGAVGVTSMWIPMTSEHRRRFLPSPTPSQSSYCSLPSSTTSSLWSGNVSKISLARKVLLQHQVLPSKAEGREDLPDNNCMSHVQQLQLPTGF